MLVGGVVTDDDTFVLRPTVARIANKIDVLPHNETHQFMAARVRAQGTVTWRVPGSGSATTPGTIDANTGHYVPPPSQPANITDVVEMLLDGDVVDRDEFTIPGSAKSLVASVTNGIEVIAAGDSHTFVCALNSRNVRGSPVVDWQLSHRQGAEFGTLVENARNQLEATYTAPNSVTGQGFALEVTVLADQDGESAFDVTRFWVTPSLRQPPPDLWVGVRQDDIELLIEPPTFHFPGHTGYRLKLQRQQADGTWLDAASVDVDAALAERTGPTGQRIPFARRFANQTPGTYRGTAQTLASNSANNSEVVDASPVTIDRDYPDTIPGAAEAPQLLRSGNDLQVRYLRPTDDGGTYLNRAYIEVYKDGIDREHRVARLPQGVLVLPYRANFPNIIAEEGAGTYQARVAWDNVNSATSGMERAWSALSPPVVVA